MVSVYLSPTKDLIPNQVRTSSISNLTSNLSWLPSYTLFVLSLPCLSAALSEFKTLLRCPMWISTLCLVCFPRVGPCRLCFVHPRGAVCQRAHHGANCPAVCTPRPLQQGKAISFSCCPKCTYPTLAFWGHLILPHLPSNLFEFPGTQIPLKITYKVNPCSCKYPFGPLFFSCPTPYNLNNLHLGSCMLVTPHFDLTQLLFGEKKKMHEFCACHWEITQSCCHRREMTSHRVMSSWRLCLLVNSESEADILSASLSEHFYFFFFCRPATSVKSRAGRAKQPLERAWPVTDTAAGKLSMSPGEFPTASPQE